MNDEEAVVAKALGIIDAALAVASCRDLMSTAEVTDIMLDVRSLLTSQEAN